MAKHAYLSASASERWLKCPPSAKLCAQEEDKGSPYAQQGTDAHELCQFLLEQALGRPSRDPTEDLTWYNAEMQEAAEGYRDFVMEQVEEAKKLCKDPLVCVEQTLDFSKWVEHGFGTGDCVIVADDLLHIIDFMKTGVLKLHNTASWGSVRKGGGIAVYNLTDGRQDFAFRPADIPQLEEADTYWVYDYFAKNAVSLGKQESYERRLDLDGFGWFVLLPKGKYGTCLGLLNKYVGFTAVESIWEDSNTQTVVIKESGTLGWLSEKDPQLVMVNSADVTSSVKKNDVLYEITLPEGPGKTVLSIVW